MGKRKRFWKHILIIAVAAMMLAVFGIKAEAKGVKQTEESQIVATVDPTTPTLNGQEDGGVEYAIDTVWVLVTGFLVFFMQCGFALLEAGFIRQKGVVNCLLENFMDAGLTALCFWAVGFGLAFGADSAGLIGTDNFFLSEAVEFNGDNIVYRSIADANPDVAYPNLAVFTFFFFQFAFAATASTITTGSMAERTDFVGDVIYTAIMAAFTYPIVVHWVWGGGWLVDRGFHDFAGSTVVHTVGGVTALVGAWMLGPRPNREFGKFPPPHNLAYATLGTMILWFGWYGFNPGSTLGASNTGLIGLVTLNTTLGAAAGTVAAMFWVWSRGGKWDLSFTLNGSLAGLVAITAGCAFVAPWAAIIIGAVAGVLVVLAVEWVEAARIDDPVGAFAVHGANGIWGTLAIGLFGQPELTFGDAAGKGGLLLGGGTKLLVTQATGSVATVIFVAAAGLLMFGALKVIGRLRVAPIADVIGIDAYEHGVSLWPDVLPMPDVTFTEAPAAKSGLFGMFQKSKSSVDKA